MPSPEVDARLLAAHVLGVDRLEPALPPDLPGDFERSYDAVLARRESREPLQHIIGHVAFRHLRLAVVAGVFVPRPETEVVAEAAVLEARARLAASGSVHVVDLCCGGGAIGLSIAHEVPGSRVVLVEADPAAVALTRANAERLGLAIELVAADVREPTELDPLTGQIDVVISNPPYIPDGMVPVDPEVARFDPATALFGGGSDGLRLPRAVADGAARLLRPGGLLVMEHADVQGAAVRALLAEAADGPDAAYEKIVTHPDLTRRDRYVTARRR